MLWQNAVGEPGSPFRIKPIHQIYGVSFIFDVRNHQKNPTLNVSQMGQSSELPKLNSRIQALDQRSLHTQG